MLNTVYVIGFLILFSIIPITMIELFFTAFPALWFYKAGLSMDKETRTFPKGTVTLNSILDGCYSRENMFNFKKWKNKNVITMKKRFRPTDGEGSIDTRIVEARVSNLIIRFEETPEDVKVTIEALQSFLASSFVVILPVGVLFVIALGMTASDMSLYLRSLMLVAWMVAFIFMSFRRKSGNVGLCSHVFGYLGIGERAREEDE